MRRIRSASLKGLLVAGSSALVLLVGELCARLMFAPPQTIEVHDAEVDRRLDAEYDVPLALALEGGQKQGPTWGGRTLYVASATGARLRANTVAQIRNHRLSGLDTVIRTNSFGYRNPEIGLKERRRVLFLGDSITLGDWLPEAETFVRRVEALSARDEEPLETINAGVSAVGLATELAILVETGVRLDPDVVVLGFYLNDAEPSRGVHLLRVPRALAWSWLARHAWRLASLALARGESGAELPERDEQDAAWRHDLRALEHDKTRWRDEIRKRFPPGDGRPQESPAAFNRVILSRIDSWGRAWSTATWRSLEPLFFELKRQASIHDFELLIVGFPVRLQVEAKFVYDHPQQELRTIAETIEAPFLDLLPLLREAHRRESVPLFYDQGHHTSRGNAVIAAAILDFIRAEVPSSE